MKETASIYRVFDAEDNLLYIGMSGTVLGRLDSHIGWQLWARDMATVRVEHFTSRADAVEAEKAAIMAEAPKFNTVHHPKHRACPDVRRPDSPPKKQGLELSDVARELRVHRNTVRRYITRGLLRVTWQGGYRISREKVDRFKRETARRKLETGRIG